MLLLRLKILSLRNDISQQTIGAMTKDEIDNRLNKWCVEDTALSEFLKSCNKRYWMYDEERIIYEIKKIFSEATIGARMNIAQIVNELLGYIERKRVGYGWINIYKEYFIDDEDISIVQKHIEEYVASIGRTMNFRKAYGYPPDSHPKLGKGYYLDFIFEEA